MGTAVCFMLKGPHEGRQESIHHAMSLELSDHSGRSQSMLWPRCTVITSLTIGETRARQWPPG